MKKQNTVLSKTMTRIAKSYCLHLTCSFLCKYVLQCLNLMGSIVFWIDFFQPGVLCRS